MQDTLLTLTGVVVGAALQYWATRSMERDKHVDTLRAQAYGDYLRAIAAARHRPRDVPLVAVLRDAGDAKARIAVYGSPQVIAALVRFEQSGAEVDRQNPGPFLALVAAMRLGAGVNPGDLETILLGPPKPMTAST